MKYELTIIINGKATAAKKKKIIENVTDIVKTNKGKVISVDDWGERDLEYKIEKIDTGIYLLFNLELDAKAVSSLPSKFNVEEEVIRYLLVRKEIN